MSPFNINSLLEDATLGQRPIPEIQSLGSLPALLRLLNRLTGSEYRFIPVSPQALPINVAESITLALFNQESTSRSPLGPDTSSVTEEADPEMRFGSLPVPMSNRRAAGSGSHLHLYNDATADQNCSDFSSGITISDYSDQEMNAIPVEIHYLDNQLAVVGHVVYCSPGISTTNNIAGSEITSYSDRPSFNNDNSAARQVAVAVADMLGEFFESRYQLWRRESELAAKVPVPLSNMNDRQLASLLQQILRAGAQSIDCTAAAMYLLNETTSELKMRSCWGLPTDRLMDAPRPVSGSLADLEAMIGQAVVVDRNDARSRWMLPDDFPAAICVPMLSESGILGTVWFYSENIAQITSTHVRMAEMAAGRLTAELEREAVIEKYSLRDDWKNQIAKLSTLQRNQLPVVAPWIEGWDIAGAVHHTDGVGGNFFDWFSLTNGNIAAALGECQQRGITAAMVASSVKTSLRAHARYLAQPEELLNQVDRTIWTSSAADQFASLFCTVLDPKSNMISYSSAGNQIVYKISETGIEDFSLRNPLLGQSPENSFTSINREIKPSEMIIIGSSSLGKRYQPDGTPINFDEMMAEILVRITVPARVIVKQIKKYLENNCCYPTHGDYSFIVIKRK